MEMSKTQDPVHLFIPKSVRYIYYLDTIMVLNLEYTFSMHHNLEVWNSDGI
jgi:hypothetical protein